MAILDLYVYIYYKDDDEKMLLLKTLLVLLYLLGLPNSNQHTLFVAAFLVFCQMSSTFPTYLPANYSMAILDLYIYYKNDDDKMFLLKIIWLFYVYLLGLPNSNQHTLFVAAFFFGCLSKTQVH